jgi:hypothetical protein
LKALPNQHLAHEEIRTCQCCGKSFGTVWAFQKFCSHQCSRNNWTRAFVKRHGGYPATVALRISKQPKTFTMECEFCGVACRVGRNHLKLKKHCSRSCAAAARYERKKQGSAA